MSAALQLPVIWGASGRQAAWPDVETDNTANRVEVPKPGSAMESRSAQPEVSLAFYRKHTESILRRYLYASMQVGRAPSVLSDSVGRGWVSSRPIRSFEDAVIFVLDVETSLNKLSGLDRRILTRVVLQEYTQTEAAALLGMGVRTMSYKFPQALDRLTQLLLDAGLLVLPH
jgi:hypothetical protein